MICPNCKTELVEVNGRYICSDCGREIPENEVMASDWGKGGNTRAGLYGAGTDDLPEVGNKPISDYGDSLSESEKELSPATPVVEDASVQDIPTEAPVEQSVEEILQEQATAAVPEQGFYTPPVEAAPIVAPLPVEPESTPEEPLVTTPVPPIETVVPEIAQPIPITVPEESPVLEPEVIPTPVIPEIPVPEISPAVEPEPSLEPAPVQEQVVTDMFESSYTPPVTNDPGIYTDPMYEATQANQQVAAPTGNVARAPMPADRKTTLIVLVSGIVITLLLITGGIWAYISLTAKVQPIVTPVSDEVTWQELQVVDGKFKLSFPGTPEKTEEKIQINGLESDATVYTSMSDDSLYLLKYAFLSVSEEKDLSVEFSAKAPLLVTEIADSLGLSISGTKIGKYYQADAIDFVASDDSSEYKGKIMILGNRYIVVAAGSDSGQTVDYDKFIKSFSFIATEATQ